MRDRSAIQAWMAKPSRIRRYAFEGLAISRLRGLAGGSRADVASLGLRSPPRSGRPFRWGTSRSGRACVPRQRRGRGRGRTLPLQRVFGCPRPLGARRSARSRAMPSRIVAGRALAGFIRGLAGTWRRQIDSGAPCFGQSDRNGLFGGTRSVPTFTDVIDLLADEFPRTRRWRLACLLVGTGPL